MYLVPMKIYESKKFKTCKNKKMSDFPLIIWVKKINLQIQNNKRKL